MNISRINNDNILNIEPSLEREKHEGYEDWEHKISDAKKFIIHRLQNDNKEIKKLCTQLEVPTDGTVSSQDTIERLRFVFETSAHTNTAVVQLKGCNTSDGTFELIEAYTVESDMSDGEFSIEISNPKYYYKIETQGTVTISDAFMIETKLELPHLYKSLELIYKSLVYRDGDHWDNKAQEYKEMFESAYTQAVYSYDADLDGTIDTDEQRSIVVREIKR